MVKTKNRGLKGIYWGGSNFGNKTTDGKEDEKTKLSFERTDAGVDFDFGEKSPDDEQFNPELDPLVGLPAGRGVRNLDQFMIRTRNGARLFLNDLKDNPLINAWVSTGEDVREEKVSGKLIGDRAYPLRMDYFKHQQKLGLVELRWKKPNGVWETGPGSVISPPRRWARKRSVLKLISPLTTAATDTSGGLRFPRSGSLL